MATLSNDYYVNKGRTVTHEGKYFREIRRFPAADLGLSQKSFDSLVRDKSIITGKERNAFVHPEPPVMEDEPKGNGLEEKSKADLQQIAEDLGLEVPSRANKDELISAILEATE